MTLLVGLVSPDTVAILADRRTHIEGSRLTDEFAIEGPECTKVLANPRVALGITGRLDATKPDGTLHDIHDELNKLLQHVNSADEAQIAVRAELERFAPLCKAGRHLGPADIAGVGLNVLTLVLVAAPSPLGPSLTALAIPLDGPIITATQLEDFVSAPGRLQSIAAAHFDSQRAAGLTVEQKIAGLTRDGFHTLANASISARAPISEDWDYVVVRDTVSPVTLNPRRPAKH